jgi:hypothetical protein
VTPSAPREAKIRRRWPYFQPQRALLWAAVGIFAGAALPWAVVLGQALWGAPLAVSWVLWAALMTLVSAVVRHRVFVISSALLGGSTAVVFALWQTGRIVSTCLSIHCLPGPGLALMFAGGGAALYHILRIRHVR